MKNYICSKCGSEMKLKGHVMACPPLTLPLEKNLRTVRLTQCEKCGNVEFEWF